MGKTRSPSPALRMSGRELTQANGASALGKPHPALWVRSASLAARKHAVTPNATTTTAASASDGFDVALSQRQVEASFARYGKAHIETDIAALEELLADDYQHFH